MWASTFHATSIQLSLVKCYLEFPPRSLQLPLSGSLLPHHLAPLLVSAAGASQSIFLDATLCSLGGTTGVRFCSSLCARWGGGFTRLKKLSTFEGATVYYPNPCESLCRVRSWLTILLILDHSCLEVATKLRFQVEKQCLVQWRAYAVVTVMLQLLR